MKRRKTIEDYLKTIYIILQKKGSVCGADIAAELNLSRPTVSVSLRGFEQEGYITMNSSREILLTEKGKIIALEIFERYQTFYKLLLKLGVDSKIAKQDACQLEHALSRDSYSALKKIHKNLCQ